MFIFRFSMNIEVSEPFSFLSCGLLLLCGKKNLLNSNETFHHGEFPSLSSFQPTVFDFHDLLLIYQAIPTDFHHAFPTLRITLILKLSSIT